MHNSNETLSVAYDCSFLGMGYANPKARTGIFVAAQQTLFALLQQSAIDIRLISFNDDCGIWDAMTSQMYLRDNQIDTSQYFDRGFTPLAGSLIQGPIFLQKYLFDTFHNTSPLLAKAAVALQIPFDKLSKTLRLNQFQPQRYQVYHSPYFSLPKSIDPGKIPRIITIYDLIPALYPDFCATRTLQRFHRIINSIDIHNDWAICISEATKQDLCDYTGMDPARAFVIPLAASDRFHPLAPSPATAAVLNRIGIGEKPYILSLATLEPRKNLSFLIRCFIKTLKAHPDLDLNLVLVGISGWKNQAIFQEAAADPKIASRIIFTGFVPDQDLNAIYSQATAFVYPSLYEGFGLPPLEAMQCGLPVITSNTSSLPEVVGDAGIMIDPTDEDALCQAILDLAKDSRLRSELSQKSLARSGHFSWAKCAAQTVEVYRVAAENSA